MLGGRSWRRQEKFLDRFLGLIWSTPNKVVARCERSIVRFFEALTLTGVVKVQADIGS